MSLRRCRRFRTIVAVVLGLSFAAPLLSQTPQRWASAMEAFDAQDSASPAPPDAIVFTGSSSVRLWDTLEEDMEPLTVLQRGFGGSTMEDAIYWLDTLVLKHRPRAVVLYEGDNDIGSYGVSAEELLAGFQTFVGRVEEALPDTRIYFLAVKPSILRWGVWDETQQANDLIHAYAASNPRVTFIDVATPMLGEDGEPMPDIFVADDLHMNAKGYAIWTSVVRPLLIEREGAYE